MKRHIPNAITLLNLFCGSIAVIYAVQNDFVAASLFVFLGIFFDFFDGLVARKLKVQSALGVQLDSLADLVTCGVVPGLIMFQLLNLSLGNSATESHEWTNAHTWFNVNFSPYALIGFLIILASAYRLAKFNIDEDQQSYFKGLPVPANTLLILSMPLIMEFQNSDAMNAIILNKWFLISLTLLSCYLLNAKMRLFALKFKDWSFKPNATRYIFLILSIVLLIVLQFAAIPVIIALYIVMSVLDNLTSK
jgi:CDP-diacylglycerol--serine O-phosphatidyltransferase